MKKKVNYGLAYLKAKNSLNNDKERRQGEFELKLQAYRKKVADAKPEYGNNAYDLNSSDWIQGTASKFNRSGGGYTGFGIDFNKDDIRRGGNAVWYRREFTDSMRDRKINGHEVKGNPELEAGKYDSLNKQEQIKNTMNDLYDIGGQGVDFIKSKERAPIKTNQVNDVLKQRKDIALTNKIKNTPITNSFNGAIKSSIFSQLGVDKSNKLKSKVSNIRNKRVNINSSDNDDNTGKKRLQGIKIK